MALVQKEIKKVYLGSTKIRPTGRQPWANCVAYYPLEDDFNDYSWNGYNLTNSWLVLGTTSDWYKWAYIGTGNHADTNGFNYPYTWNWQTTWTIAFWLWCNTLTEGSWSIAILSEWATNNNANAWIWYTTYDYPDWWLWYFWIWDTFSWSTMRPLDWVNMMDANNMHSYVITINSTTFSMYKDWVLAVSAWISWAWYTTGTWFRIWNESTDVSQCIQWYVRHFVYDTSVWTLSDVQAYHNWTA